MSEPHPLPRSCPFCRRIKDGAPVVASTEHAVAFVDAYPVSAGHVLVASRRHTARVTDLSGDELQALWALIPAVLERIQERYGPEGYNVGINDGAAAGQTVPHVHLHVIPRYAGDSADPRGGIRWVLPDRAAYWKPNDGG